MKTKLNTKLMKQDDLRSGLQAILKGAKQFLLASSLVASIATGAVAQEAVTVAENPDALFTSADPKLNANKQIVYHIVKDMLEAGHWDEIETYLTPAYVQHNPAIKSGRDGVLYFFTQVLKVQPKPIPEKMASSVVSVTAEGDFVTVATKRVLKDPHDPSRTYTTTWFDMWRIVDGKANEHWDNATLSEPQL